MCELSKAKTKTKKNYNNNKFVNSILVVEDGAKQEGVVLQNDERRMEETLRHMRRYLNT